MHQQMQIQELTKQRQAQVLKNQQEKEKLKAQTLENRDNTDRASRTKSKISMTQPEDNGENIDDTNSPRPQRSKGKASHPDQIKSSKKNRKMPRATGNATVQCLMIFPQTQTPQMKIL